MSDRNPLSMSAPGSSANIGPGFDVLGLALDLRAEVGSGPPPEHARMVEETHPAFIAHRGLGGTGELWVRSQLPMGRGLGYSGAVRAAASMLAIAQREHDPLAAHDAEARREAFLHTADLEGHPDNAGASVYGGLVVTTSDDAVAVPCGLDLVVVVWIPESTTSTDSSRARLDPVVSRNDAVLNLRSLSMLLLGLAQGDEELVARGTADWIHQPTRLEAAPASRAALEAMMQHGAIGAWLSGSGPTVACFSHRDQSEQLVGLIDGGEMRVINIDHIGVTAS